MNLEDSIFTNLNKTPRSIYFDDGISTDTVCCITGELKKSLFSTEKQNFLNKLKET